MTRTLHRLRSLTAFERSVQANRRLGFILTFIAGAVNAGAFLLAHQYTSHVTGLVTAIADNLALGSYSFAIVGCAALITFLGGALLTTILVSLSLHWHLHSVYALPLLIEGSLLLCV